MTYLIWRCSRYGNAATLTKSSGADGAELAKTFTTNFAPEILKAYLGEIEKWVSKTIWLSKASLSFTLVFLDECIKPKLMWAHLKPHIETLLAHVIFPILCQSNDDLELFETDPQEYVHRKLNMYEEVSAPDVAAASFLVTLTKSRKKQTFTIVNFVNGIVNKYESAPEGEKDAREKEGALRMIGTLAEVLLAKKSPIAHQVEYFFVRHVFPEFRSPHGFLRARACDSLQKFERLEFNEQSNLILVYRNVLESMTDPDLPVRVEAAMALQALIRHPIIRAEMQSNIPQIMQQLLKLANEVDVDSLSNVMEDFVEEFATELTPFAVALSEQLRDTYMRIIRDLLDRNQNKDDDDQYGDMFDDKSITALGVLQTIGTLILTLESTPDVLLHLETILMPVVTITLENKLFGTNQCLKYMTSTNKAQIFTTKYSKSSTAALLPPKPFHQQCGRPLVSSTRPSKPEPSSISKASYSLHSNISTLTDCFSRYASGPRELHLLRRLDYAAKPCLYRSRCQHGARHLPRRKGWRLGSH